MPWLSAVVMWHYCLLGYYVPNGIHLVFVVTKVSKNPELIYIQVVSFLWHQYDVVCHLTQDILVREQMFYP